ncbi:MAG TPA: D-alanyl-D-alanine carboxypeptidase/D-alanyl-D-alanine-endopeptidase [Rhodobacteraceae bacterium]|nr:D-alanyl-D-alanine carboxypeptidase/D-alanyl-D-alanine-endopeptidase [Paracoccaceae bacterium]HBG97442.1 D-alanyl-D-alanine carboxypeptidase/D-alanyl-D-alanine-endopeptidase [Paracoccaceae bacterium]
MIGRRTVLAGLAAGLAAPACARPPATASRPPARPPDGWPSPEALFAQAGLSGEAAFLVADAATGELLEARAPGRALPPASVMKALTALYALEAPGPGHRFATTLRAAGPVSGGVLRGDLILEGGGDPSLDTGALAGLARALPAAGISRVDGRFLIDGAALPAIPRIDPAQPVYAGYDPAVGGLNLNFNRVYFHWQRRGAGYEVGMAAQDSRSPQVAMARMRVASRAAPLYAYEGGDGIDSWSVAAGALGAGGGRWLPVRHPDRYAGDVFRTLAAGQGVTLPAPRPGGNRGAAVIARHASPPADALVLDMLKYSTNLTAEVMGLTGTAARGRDARSLAASAGAMADWLARTHGTGRVRLVDHSGLGDASRIAPQALVNALATAGWQGRLRGLMKPVVLKDERGRRMADPPVAAVGKTGTLHFVTTLAGYAETAGGRRLVFAVLCADLDRRAALRPDQRDRPPGARSYARAARGFQYRLLERWGRVYGG